MNLKKKFVLGVTLNLVMIISILVGGSLLIGIFGLVIQYFFGQEIAAIILVGIALLIGTLKYFRNKKRNN